MVLVIILTVDRVDGQREKKKGFDLDSSVYYPAG
jgi:hypothetical protein